MFELMQEIWSFAFMRRAFVATTVLSASVAPVGAFLVLRSLSLAGEAMAHAITPGIVIGFVVAGLSVISLLVGGLIAGVGVAILTAWLARKTILRSDASLASLYLIALAAGIFILSAAGSAVPLKSFLFGSILGIDDASMILVVSVATVTLLAFAVMLRPLIVSTCDPVFFEAQTRRPWIVEQGFMLLLVLNLLAAFKTLGTLMAVGLMILPATAARYWASTITGQLALTFAFALASCWIGLTLSYLLPETPSGPAIVLVAGGFFTISAALGPLGFGGRLRKSATASAAPAVETKPKPTPITGKRTL
ncbi:MAG: metal ABC transporter permease [Pseudomonadota bacterium]